MTSTNRARLTALSPDKTRAQSRIRGGEPTRDATAIGTLVERSSGYTMLVHLPTPPSGSATLSL